MNPVSPAFRSEPRMTRTRPRIAFEARGTGPAIVFAHGIGGNRSNWADQLEAFAANHQVVAVDLRGYGSSEWQGERVALEDFAADISAVMDELGIQKAHMVGLSMGGLVVQAFYARWPDRVLSLVLAACRGAHAPVADGEDFAKRRLEPLRRGGSEALADMLLPTLVGPAITPEMLKRLRQSLTSLVPANYMKVIDMRIALKPFLDMSRITVPTLVLGGSHDKLAPPEQMRDIHLAIPQAGLSIIENSGHFLNIEKPQEFNRLLAEFFQ
jgi:3-oxoadipate enol-lactonase